MSEQRQLAPILNFAFPTRKRKTKKATRDAKKSPPSKRSLLSMLCYTSLKDLKCLPSSAAELAPESTASRVASWIAALPDSPTNHITGPRAEHRDEGEIGKAPLQMSYRIEPTALQPTSPAQARLRKEAAHKGAASSLSLKEICLDENLIGTGSGASLFPSCGLAPHGLPVIGALHTGASLQSFGAGSPDLSLDGSFPWLIASPDKLQTRLQQEGLHPNPFGHVGPKWKQGGGESVSGMQEGGLFQRDFLFGELDDDLQLCCDM